MKNRYLLFALSALSTAVYAQNTGINTQNPKALLEIQNNLDPTIPNGLIAPKISGVELRSKDPLYGTEQDGIMVHVIHPLAEPNKGKTEGITEPGYYYYGAVEQKWFKLDNYIDRGNKKTIVQITRAASQQMTSIHGTDVKWVNIVQGDDVDEEDVTLEGADKTIIALAAGKSYKIIGAISVGLASLPGMLKSQFVLAEPISGTAKIYFSTPGTVESSKLNTPKGAGVYPVCYVYTGDLGLKLKLVARSNISGVTVGLGPIGVDEGTFLTIQEL